MSWLNLSRSGEELLVFYSSLFHSDYKGNECPFGEYCGGLFQAEAVYHSTSRSCATSMTTSTGH